jgi:hypothetical protein
MRQKVNVEKREGLFSRRVEFDLPEKMLEIRQLRKAVRMAETESVTKPIVARPERPVHTRAR